MTTTTTTSTSGSFLKNGKETPQGFTHIEEGYAKVLFKQDDEVFYNKVQVMNRDLSTLVINTYNQHLNEKKSLTILEALSATGLRAIRYWKEIPNIQKIVANDLSDDAVQAIKRNLEYNDVPLDSVVPNKGDAIDLLYSQRSKQEFNVIDLDPYGSASIFLDGAMQAVQEGGLLCVTCTDLAVLAGSNAGTCFSKYGAMPVKTQACHELALRILLATLQQTANRHKRVIEPLISVYLDFYIRVFVRVKTSPKESKESFTKFGTIYQCMGCEAYEVQPLGRITNSHQPAVVKVPHICPQCGDSYKLGGPYWTAPLHRQDFVKLCLNHVQQNSDKFKMEKRIKGLLTILGQELPDVPLFYDLGHIAKKFKMSSPPMVKVRSAILNAGYQVSMAHCMPNSIKTNAPVQVLYDIMRVHYNQEVASKQEQEQEKKQREIKDHPNKKEMTEEQKKIKDKRDQKKQQVNTVSAALLAKPITTNVNFTEREEAKRATNLPLYLPNPEPEWGPKKAKKITGKRPREDDEDEQSAKQPKLQ